MGRVATSHGDISKANGSRCSHHHSSSFSFTIPFRISQPDSFHPSIMHFSTLIAAFLLPLAVLGAPIAQAELDAINHATKLFRGAVLTTLLALDRVDRGASAIVNEQLAPLVNQVKTARAFVSNGSATIEAGFSPDTEPHTPDTKYVGAYSSLLVRILTTVFVLSANKGA